MRPTVIFYGNCQAMAISYMTQPALEAAGMTVRRVAGFDADHDLGPHPSPEELDAATVLFEQLDADGFPSANALGSHCRRVTFPSIDSNLQWPFGTLNPYADGGGIFRAAFQGNRILQRAVNSGWSADRCVRYYLEEYDDFRVDLARLERLNETRARERSGQADVPVDDLIGDIRAEKRFFSPAHPIVPTLVSLANRLVAAADLPSISASPFDEYSVAVRGSEIPIHPRVAQELGLRWYHPSARYLRPDGTELDHDQYVRWWVDRAIAARARIANAEHVAGDPRGWSPTLDGLEVVGGVLGYYPDRLCAPVMQLTCRASRACAGIQAQVYVPQMHDGETIVELRVGEVCTRVSASPGSTHALRVDVPLAAGERVEVTLTSSRTLNMLESGQGTDGRDLGVLLMGASALATHVTN